MQQPLGLYVHIPFCAARCPYCDFNTYAGLESQFDRYTAALVRDIRQTGEILGHPPARTLFIGGGTPTVLPPQLLARVLESCRDAFDLAPQTEITSEANPGAVDQARFDALRAMGVNRLSMGVQSFDDTELRFLGRIHTASEAEAAFLAARAAGFANISLDFIFGLPDQQPAAWTRTLRRAISLAPEHLSLYSLIVEDGTPLANQVQQGLVPPADDDLAADLYLAACELLHDAGYVHYEISNWAKAASPNTTVSVGRPSTVDLRCLHNLIYWRNEPYLGFGPGAHSFDGQRRWWAVRPVPEYIRRIEASKSPEADGEPIDRRLAMGETLMLGLRLLIEGVADDRFCERFDVGLDEMFGTEIDLLVQQGLLDRLRDRIRLTPDARLLGNQVFGAFLPD